MNVLDALLLIGLLLAAARGFFQGALSQVAAFGGAAIGLLAGAAFGPDLAGLFVDSPGPALAVITLGVVAVAVLLGQGIGFTIGLRLRRAAAGVGAGPVDRTAGVAVGLAGLVLVVWLLAGPLSQGPSATVAQQIRQSAVVGTLTRALPPAPDLFSRVGNYLDQQGFPQVFSELEGSTAPPVEAPSDTAVAAAQQAGQGSTVQIRASGCPPGFSTGSGFVTQPGFVVTNAHVVAGSESITVRDPQGSHEATPILYDPQVDLAVLSVPGTAASPIAWASSPVGRGTAGAALGHPGGQPQLNVEPAVVRERRQALGRDIYGGEGVSREVLILSARVRRGDSGGPFVTSEGQVGGVVFAAAPQDPGTGYALTVDQVRPDVQSAISRNQPADTGACRF